MSSRSSRPTDRKRDSPRPVPRPWRSSLVLVCGECDGVREFGPKQARKALKAHAKSRLPPKAVRIVKVSCLDVCPQQAVTVAVVGAGETAVTINGPAGAARLVEELGRAIDAGGA